MSRIKHAAAKQYRGVAYNCNILAHFSIYDNINYLDGAPFWPYAHGHYTMRQKTAPFYFCNNFVKSFFIRIIIGIHIYPNKFGTK